MSMTISPDVSLEDVTLASKIISAEASEDANVIWGVSFDSDLEDEMKITIIATGFDKKNEQKPAEKKPAPAPAPAPEVKTIPAVKPATPTTVSAKAPEAGKKTEDKPAEPAPVSAAETKATNDIDWQNLMNDYFGQNGRK